MAKLGDGLLIKYESIIPQAPTDTYGAIESNELVISLDRVCQCQYLFIRGSEIKLTAQRKQAYINAYLNGVNVYKTSINPVLPLAWTRIDFPNVEFNQLVLPGGFEINSIYVSRLIFDIIVEGGKKSGFKEAIYVQ